MRVGVPKESKNHEYRVGLTPSLVQGLTAAKHQLVVEAGAGSKIGYTDAMYIQAGATIAATAEEVYQADMIVKVKEPQESEIPLLREGQILFCYLHLAPNPTLTEQLVKRGVIAIAYETVTDEQGRLPLLVPMSEIAGRISIQVGAACLQMNHGGKGILLGGVPGVPPAKVLILGGGIVGTEAARMALGCGADVTIVDKKLSRLRELDALFGPSLKTLYSTSQSIHDEIKQADLVIGAVLIPGKTAPKLVSREMVSSMMPGSVIVDVAIDQGGCIETAHVTTHAHPTYIVDHVVHYCVANIPALCALTSTQALTNATAEAVMELANQGYAEALRNSTGLRNGLNIYRGKVTNSSVAEDLGYVYSPFKT